ncbi:hypothetical protein TRFO_06705 [Tritrichomonas foetus]|uniref:E3 ubiquitin protein ligase n=1 Tax=Tritrichomonas foetus TaxID=1144522 RepID=A0A1J4JWE2_9EUKA|nr:hypothetical protein TRFO_06705 [Tritrichomonas foetus]|eukprot:OHT03455.1 hypothetical protein TRFO_06705 [Tritrichomonas foetus]
MLEEKWMKQFLANNPSLTERMKRLEEQRRIESVIINDLGYLVAYQQNFAHSFSVNLVRLKHLNHSPTKIAKISTKNPQFSTTEETIRLIKLSSQIRKIIFQITAKIASEDDFTDLQDVHLLFDQIIYYRNMKCTTYRNNFIPLPLFRITQSDRSHRNSQKKIDVSDSLNLSSPHFDSTYHPTKFSLWQIQEKMNNRHHALRRSLKTINSDLNKTYKELLNLRSEFQVTNLLVQDFTLFPPFDVIRESPVFHEFNNSISYSINYVRSEISTLQKAISGVLSIISKLGECTKCLYSLPQFEAEHKNKINFYDAKHRLSLFHNIIRSSDAFKSSIDEYEAIKYTKSDYDTFKKLNELQSGEKYEELSTLFETALEYYTNAYDLVSDEISQLDIKEKEIKEKISQWQAKKVHPLSEEINQKREKLINLTEQMEREIVEDKKEIADLLQQTLNEFKEKISDLNIKNPLIPSFFEDLLTKYFGKEPKKEWVEQKLHFQQIENEKLKKNVEDSQKNLSDLKEEIIEKRKRIDLLQKVENRNTSKSQTSLNEKVLCPICKDRQRDVIITKCGHTFCRKCIEILWRNGNHKCPHCHAFFVESNVISIQW